jgi:hypothetical protein
VVFDVAGLGPAVAGKLVRRLVELEQATPTSASLCSISARARGLDHGQHLDQISGWQPLEEGILHQCKS